MWWLPRNCLHSSEAQPRDLSPVAVAVAIAVPEPEPEPDPDPVPCCLMSASLRANEANELRSFEAACTALFAHEQLSVVVAGRLLCIKLFSFSIGRG